jgi:hypothetical protein
MQLCPECRYLYHSDSRIPCLSCESTRLTIPTAENLVGVVSRLLDRHIAVVSATCDVHDVYDDIKGYIGKTVQIQIELGRLYPMEMYNSLPPNWGTYIYHTTIDNQIGPAYTGLCHVDSFLKVDNEEYEFATALTISNIECWLNDMDPFSFWSVWKLAGELE